MSVNSSCSSSESLLHPNLSSISSCIPFGMKCLITRPSSLIYATFFIINIILMLPLYICILYLGLKRWRQQRSTSTAAMTSHSDSFTYHMVAMELIGVLGFILCCCGIFRDHFNISFVGLCLCNFTWYGELFFHMLTCVELYLAVVHPITYLSLRRARGIRIRNISIGCVWLFCFGGTSLTMTMGNVSLIIDFCLLIFSLTAISFCSLSVLCFLIRPGPGEQGGDRERVDQSKHKAFYTIVAILGVLLLRCVWSLVWTVLSILRDSECMLKTLEVWFNFPTSLVLPLLFLHRAGTLVCCKNNTE